MKAYKVFNPDWTCREYQYAVGGEYKMAGTPVVCERGFHACEKLVDCFNYYEFNPNNKVAEVELLGEIVRDENKVATNHIAITKELTWNDVLNLVNFGKGNTGRSNTGDWNTGDCNTGHRNTGDWNTGHRNTGDWNTGHWNTGDRNTGHRNTGDWNTGHRNTGHWNTGHWNTGDWNTGNRNTGHRNTGDWNTGHRNTGDWNTGHRNTGDWNTCSFETGFLNSKQRKTIRVFNKEIRMTRETFLAHAGVKLLSYVSPTCDYDGKTEPQKKWYAAWWKNLDDEQKAAVKNIPGFDTKVFKKITGINVEAKRS